MAIWDIFNPNRRKPPTPNYASTVRAVVMTGAVDVPEGAGVIGVVAQPGAVALPGFGIQLATGGTTPVALHADFHGFAGFKANLEEFFS